MRKKFDYWGVPFNELFPNYRASYTAEYDYGERAKRVKNYRLYRCPTCGKEYTLSYGDYILIDKKRKKR